MTQLRTLLAVLTILLLAPLTLKAQGGNTTIIGTVKDASNNPYSNSRVSISFFDPGTSHKLPLLNGSTFQVTYTGYATDSFGGLPPISLADNGVIGTGSGATGTQWSISICFSNQVTCFQTKLTIDCANNLPATCVANTVDITAALQAVAAPLPTVTLPASLNGNNNFVGVNNFAGGGSLQGTWTAGPTYTISTISETGNIVTAVTTTPCSAITAAFQSIVVSGVGIAGYNAGPSGLVGFATAGACAGSTFTYFNPTSGLGASSGGTVVVSPTFSQGLTHTGPETISGQLTVTNHNGVFWAGPGPTPTIDQAVANCSAPPVPCIVTISPLYTGPESANLFTTSTTYKVYNGAQSVTIEDLRSADSGIGNPAGTPLYPITYGGRSDGELARMGINEWCSSPTDSCVGSADYVWFQNTFPSNGGAIMAASSVAVLHDSVTIGAPATVSPVVGRDGEVWLDATSIDRSLPYATAFSGQALVNRANSTMHTVTASSYSAPNCLDTVGGLINTCFGFDSSCCTNGAKGNYSFHGSNFLSEINGGIDFTDAGNAVTTTSMATTTATYNTTGICLFTAGMNVEISGVATIAGGSYNGIYPVLAGCGGGTSFTVTLPFSGLGASSGGLVRGIHSWAKWLSSDSSITHRLMLDSVGEKWNRDSDLATIFQITSAGTSTKGQANPSSAAGAFLGQGSLPWAGLIIGTGTNLSYTLNPVAPASNRTINILDPGAATVTMDLTSNTSTTTTQVLHASANAGTGTYAAIATADIATALTAPGPIGSTTPSTGAFTTLSSTGNFTPSQTNGIVGTTTNNNANAGSVGEYVASTIVTGSSVTLATGVTSNITSISLTAGDWDVTGAVDFTFGATTSYTNLIGSVSSTSATIGAQDSKFDFETPAAVPTAGADSTFPLPVVRFSLSGTTTVFLVAQGTFTVSTLKAYGTIRARRIR